MTNEEVLCLDVGAKRIGVARAGTIARIPEMLPAIIVDGQELQAIKDLVSSYGAKKLVIGLPRNQSGEETEQTRFVRDFAAKITGVEIIWQDESLTSVVAEDKLKSSGQKYNKSDIDSMAAAHILKDYLDEN
jgi:putative Holliday junction resolvase